MSSPTIRYSGVPENSHSLDSDLTRRFRAAAAASASAAAEPRADQPTTTDLNPSNPHREPTHPHREPDHLRHQPGDTWIIDKRRPYDVLDPGPYGSPGWFPDRRTGRHRRDELPDPISQHEIDEEPDKAEWADRAEALYERRTRITRGREAREAREALEVREAAPAEPRRPDESKHAEEPKRSDRSGPPYSGSGSTRWARKPAPEPSPDVPYRFSKLREDAWHQFLIKSEPLAAAHHASRPPGRMARLIKGLTATLRRTQIRPRPAPPSPIARLNSAHPNTPHPDTLRPNTSRSTPRSDTNNTTVPRQRVSPRPPDLTALALRTSRMASAFRGAERARTELAAARLREPAFGGAAWA